MNIVLIGGTIEALLVAEHCSKDHTVSIIEIEAELGLPSVHPGRFIDVDLFKSYFTEEQLEFLCMQANSEGWGCRWDWVLKHLAANVARQGVQFFTRTRVLSSTKHDEKIILELNSSERATPIRLISDRVVLFSDPSTGGPGGKNHNFHPSQPETFHPLPSVSWFGGTVLSKDVESPNSAELVIQRADGMTELWWKGSPTWKPTHGFIEQCTNYLSPDVNHLSFDSVVGRVRAFLEKPFKL